jgi:osmoprotectant transport system ATP-binding protein
VRHSYRGDTGLGPLDLSIAAGERVALVGSSGSGKSTLLRLVLGLLTPTLGTVSVFGEALTRKRLPEVRQRSGYVVQDGGLFPHLTARANIELRPRHLGWAGERMAQRTAELAQLIRLQEEELERLPRELSGGQRQRVGIARALALDPPLLLLDEPLGALDPLVRASLQHDLLTIFTALKKTVVLVTHDLAEALQLATRIVLLDRGQVVQDAAPAELMRAPANDFVRRFVASIARGTPS